MSRITQVLGEIAHAQKTADTAGIFVETRTMKRFLFFREISFIEVIGKKVYFRLLDGSDIEINAVFSELLPKFLEDSRFVQCHRAFVVNLDAVLQIQGKEVFFRCGRKAPVAQKNTYFFEKYTKWLLKK